MNQIPDKVNSFVLDNLFDNDLEAIVKINKGASSREYYRLFFKNGDRFVLSYIYNDKKTEFIDTTYFLDSHGIYVPKIFKHDKNIILMEDLGSSHVFDMIFNLGDDQIVDIYKDIIDGLIEFQKIFIDGSYKNRIYYKRGLDLDRLEYEFDFSMKHFIKNYLDIDILPNDKSKFHELNKFLSSNIESIVHRDFHSMNLILKNDKVYWIDYQDMMLGSSLYDISSLLEDPYANLALRIKSNLFDYYISKYKAEISSHGIEDYIYRYKITSIQRLFKAMGTYGYQCKVVKNKEYERYIHTAFDNFKVIAEELSIFNNMISDMEASML